jgi:hypothetical protein
MMRRLTSARWYLAWLPVLAVLCGAAPSVAQERDPTEPPANAFPGPSEGNSASPKTPWGSDGMAVVVRNGKSYLVVDTRLYAVGQKVGSSRIERITETEVWLKDGAVRRKVPRFSGIERRQVVAQPQTATSGPRSKTRKASKITNKAKAL